MQREKKHVKDRVVIMPETFLGNMHLLECAVQNIENDVGDMMMLPQQPGTISDHQLRDDFKSVTRLLDKGEERVIKFDLPFLFAGTHQGPDDPDCCGVLICPSSYNFVASNKPSPTGMREVTQSSPWFFKDFPASRRATVFGSR